MSLHKLKSEIFCLLRSAFIRGSQSDKPEWGRERNLKYALKEKAQAEGKAPTYYYEDLIFTGTTHRTYWSIGKTFAEFMYEAFDIGRVRDIRPAHIREFMRQGIEEKEWSKKYAKLVASAIAKIGATIGRGPMFSRGALPMLRRHFPDAAPPRVITDEQFRDAYEWLKSVGASEGRLLAVRLARHGLRVSEVTYKWRWFMGNGDRTVCSTRDQTRWFVRVCGKGGKWRTVEIPAQLGRDLDAFFRENGDMKLDEYDGHRHWWAEACRAVGAPQNTHARRHRAARRVYVEKRIQGKTSEDAVNELMEILGHGYRRRDITDLYLGQRSPAAKTTLADSIRTIDRIKAALMRIK